jgi:hypothetical protein
MFYRILRRFVAAQILCVFASVCSADPLKAPLPPGDEMSISVPVKLRVSVVSDELTQRFTALEHRVGVLEKSVEQNGKKLDRILSTLGPMSQWVQEQRKAKETQAKKAASSEEVSHLVWDSPVGECHFRINPEGRLETKLVGRGQTEWSSLHSVSDGWLYAIYGNTYYRLGSNEWLMSYIRQYKYCR